MIENILTGYQDLCLTGTITGMDGRGEHGSARTVRLSEPKTDLITYYNLDRDAWAGYKSFVFFVVKEEGF